MSRERMDRVRRVRRRTGWFAIFALLATGGAFNSAAVQVQASPASAAATSARSSAVKGDFDHNGVQDLAVGVPGEDADSGGVHVIYGSAPGLTSDGDQFWGQDSPGIEETAEGGDEFGRAMAVGDFDGDGVDDLAIGVPGEGFDDEQGRAGGVNVIYGRAGVGLTSAGNQFWSQDTPGIKGHAEFLDGFGYALAAADFGAGPQDDLAIGVPIEDFAGRADGGVNVIYGSSDGLTASGDQFWSQDSPGIKGTAESGDWFGRSLAAANFGNGARADLAVGVPQEDFAQGATDDGGVQVIYGSAAGLTSTRNQFWSQDSPHVEESAESGNSLGSALVAADFGKSGHADLAVGVPGEGITANELNVGGVNVLYGSMTGLTSAGDQFWDQNSLGIQGTAEPGDRFGLALAAADFGRSPQSDLAVGVPYEHFAGGLTDDGGVNVIYGSATGLTSTGNQFWSQDSPGIEGIAEAEDHFGLELAAANFGNASQADLAVGVPNEDFTGGLTDDGGVNVIYGSATGLTSNGNQFWSQDSPGIEGTAETGDGFGGSVAAAGP